MTIKKYSENVIRNFENHVLKMSGTKMRIKTSLPIFVVKVFRLKIDILMMGLFGKMLAKFSQKVLKRRND